jgi:hypothetical protein
MSPEKYARAITNLHGFDGAYNIVLRTLGTIESVGVGGCPFADEVEMVEQQTRNAEGKVVNKTVTIIDHAAQAKRQSKTLEFWKNVHGFMKKRKPASSKAA